MAMHTILVTGGAGFIGSCFVRMALERGLRVVTLDALTYAGNRANLDGLPDAERHVFVEGDICDAALVGRLLAEHRPDALVNFAAESHVDRSIDGPDAFVRTNIDGAFVLLEASRTYWRNGGAGDDFRLLHVSTDEVYGSTEDGLFDEDAPYRPNSPYAASKAAADHLVRAYNRTYGAPTLITNCGNNYGPRQFPEKLIPHMILSALAGKPLPVYGDGRNVRDWIFVEDHCHALFRVLEAGVPGATYNVGAGDRRENIEIVRLLCAALDEAAPRPEGSYAQLIAFVEDRPGHDRRYALDASRIADELGWQPKIGLEQGIARTVAWYLENRDWWQALLERGYRTERIGLAQAMP